MLWSAMRVCGCNEILACEKESSPTTSNGTRPCGFFILYSGLSPSVFVTETCTYSIPAILSASLILKEQDEIARSYNKGFTIL